MAARAAYHCHRRVLERRKEHDKARDNQTPGALGSDAFHDSGCKFMPVRKPVRSEATGSHARGFLGFIQPRR